jgi:hypothetical protein
MGCDWLNAPCEDASVWNGDYALCTDTSGASNFCPHTGYLMLCTLHSSIVDRHLFSRCVLQLELRIVYSSYLSDVFAELGTGVCARACVLSMRCCNGALKSTTLAIACSVACRVTRIVRWCDRLVSTAPMTHLMTVCTGIHMGACVCVHDRIDYSQRSATSRCFLSTLARPPFTIDQVGGHCFVQQCTQDGTLQVRPSVRACVQKN